MFLVVFVYVYWKPQHQNKFLVCATTLGNKAFSDCVNVLFICLYNPLVKKSLVS